MVLKEGSEGFIPSYCNFLNEDGITCEIKFQNRAVFGDVDCDDTILATETCLYAVDFTHTNLAEAQFYPPQKKGD